MNYVYSKEKGFLIFIILELKKKSIANFPVIIIFMCSILKLEN